MNKRKSRTAKAVAKRRPVKTEDHSSSESDTPIIKPILKPKKLELQLNEKDIAYYKLIFFGGFYPSEALNDLFAHMGYTPPEVGYAKKEILPMLYEKCLKERKKQLETISNLSLTCELQSIVTSRFENDVYYSKIIIITAHLINANFQPQTIVLHYRHLEDCMQSDLFPDQELVLDSLNFVISEWKLHGKIVSVTFNDELKIPKDRIDDGSLNVLSCFANTFNKIMFQSLEPISTFIDKLHNLNHWLKMNQDDMMEIQKQLGYESIVKAKICYKELWCTYLPMLQRTLLLENCIKHLMQFDSFQTAINEDLIEAPEQENWVLMRELFEVLSPFEEVAKSLSDQGFLRASEVIAMSRALSLVCNKFNTDDYQPVVKDIIEKIKEGLKNNFDNVETNLSLATCTIMDPRYKEFVFLNKDAAKNVVKKLEEKVEKIISYKSSFTDSQTEATSSSSKPSIWACINNVDEDNSKAAMNQAVREVEIFLKRDVLNRLGDPVKWWEENANIYPNLIEVYLNECHMIASSVPCGNIFNKKDVFDSENRILLKEDEIAFLKFNMNDEEMRSWLSN